MARPLQRLFALAWLLAQAVAFGQAPPLSAYAKLPALDLPVLSPSGRHVAYVNHDGARRWVRVRSLDGAARVEVSKDLGDTQLRSLEWAGDDWLVGVFSNTVNLGAVYGDEHELLGVFALDRRSSKLSVPTRQAGYLDAALGVYGVRQVEGRWAVHVGMLRTETSAVTRRTHLSRDSADLARIDLESNALTIVARGRRHLRDWALDAQGKVVAHSLHNADARRWSLHAGASDAPALVELEDATEDSDLVGLGRAPATVLYSVRSSDGERRLMELALAPGSAPQELRFDAALESLWFDPLTRQFAGYVAQLPGVPMRLFNRPHQARLDAAGQALPGHQLRLVSASGDFGRFILQGEALDDAGTWWLVDVASGKADPLGAIRPDIADQQVAPWRVVEYRAADGLALDGVLTLPRESAPKPPPLVVLPHGGPAAHDRPGFHWWAQAFASRGYAVWQPNFRGSTGRGGAVLRAGWGEWGRKMQTDIDDGVAELVRQELVDAQRACIVGASYGGFAALAGVTLQQGRYQCAVSVAGVSDLELLVMRSRERGGRGAQRYWERFIGADLAPFAAGLDARSPVRLAARADAPVLLIHGRADTVVPLEHSTAMRRALARAGKPVTLIELDGEDHHLWRERTRIQMLEAAVAFVMQHNPIRPR